MLLGIAEQSRLSLPQRLSLATFLLLVEHQNSNNEWRKAKQKPNRKRAKRACIVCALFKIGDRSYGEQSPKADKNDGNHFF
ncbi:MAG: hypothetical protein OHK0053_16950 [Microscillaceae bacterium]